MTSPKPVSSLQAMIAEMNPVLDESEYLFCTVADKALAETVRDEALAWFCEEEGLSLILRADRAQSLGLSDGPPMRRLVLTVYSALDGVGLTAAVAGRLAEAGIACNVLAAYYHDHVFVPANHAERALGLLRELQTSSRG